MPSRRSAPESPETRLVRVLQSAYSGELAAIHAYRGHAASLRDARQRADVERIADEERDHRERVGRILAAVGACPDPARERRFERIGRLIGLLCRVGGWFVPMYGAGRLERGNIAEYEHAARLALAAGHGAHVDDLLDMAEVEWDHEAFFRAHVQSHWLRRVFPLWPPPPARADIRRSFAL